MEESLDQQSADSKAKSSSSVILPTVFDTIINWVINPFLITEEEKQEAGIYIGRLGKDE